MPYGFRRIYSNSSAKDNFIYKSSVCLKLEFIYAFTSTSVGIHYTFASFIKFNKNKSPHQNNDKGQKQKNILIIIVSSFSSERQ